MVLAGRERFIGTAWPQERYETEDPFSIQGLLLAVAFSFDSTGTLEMARLQGSLGEVLKVRLDRDILVIEEGLVFKKRTEIPLSQITSVGSSGLFTKTWTVRAGGSVHLVKGNDALMKGILQRREAENYRPAPSSQVVTQRVVQLRCSYCRTLNEEGAAICANCHARL